MNEYSTLKRFFKGKKVLITGHTGFKGSWLCRLLLELGAEVSGYSLEPPTEPSMFELCGLGKDIASCTGDIRDLEKLRKVMEQEQPELVIHMAAQPIVRESYKNPVYTYEVNVMGTVNILESLRHTDSVRSFLNVTTDKVYRNREWQWGYRENEELNGFDPYSNSKSCSELVTSAYRSSFFAREERDVSSTSASEQSALSTSMSEPTRVSDATQVSGASDAPFPAISTARAGNVIGGGDFAKDRIVPDCVRALQTGREMIIRNPDSIRPFQHVLEPLMAYLMILRKQWENPELQGSYNVGPEEADCCTTGKLVEMFAGSWEKRTGRAMPWKVQPDGGPHEANCLKLDCAKIKSVLGWKPRLNVAEAVDWSAEWYAAFLGGESVKSCTEKQISRFLEIERRLSEV